MSVFSGLEISSNGMTAHRAWLELASVNLANAETTRTATGGPFRRKLLVLAEDEKGVRVEQIAEDDSPLRVEHDPSHPDADAQGLVRLPNVHPVLEMVDLIAATRGYELNAQALTAQKQMLQQALDLLR